MDLQEISHEGINHLHGWSRGLRSWLCLLLVPVLLSCNRPPGKLPILGKHKVLTEPDNGLAAGDTVYHSIPPFSLTDQDGRIITNRDVRGKVCVADFFFASCPSICPIMTKQLVRVQSILGEEPGFIILSHTVDPERDTPEVLRQYADKFGAHTGNWHFLTGPKEDIYDLGWNGYYLSMAENKDSGGGFIHSPKFTLVDRQGHIRGWYDGTDAAEVDRMIVDIRSLL